MSPNPPDNQDPTQPVRRPGPSDPDATQAVPLPGQPAPRPGAGSDQDPTIPPAGATPGARPNIYVDPAYGQGSAGSDATQAMPGGPQPQYGAPQYGSDQYGSPQYGSQQYGSQDNGPDYGQQPYEYVDRPEDPARSIWWPIAVIMVSLAIIGAIGGYLWATHDNAGSPPPTGSVLPTAPATSNTPSSSPTPSSTQSSSTQTSTTESSTSSATSTESSSSTSTDPSTSASSSTATAAFPAGARVCGPTVAGNAKASCGFATNVATAAAGPISQGQSAFQVQAHSPVTNRDYTLDCSGTGLVTCSTDTGADVYILAP